MWSTVSELGFRIYQHFLAVIPRTLDGLSWYLDGESTSGFQREVKTPITTGRPSLTLMAGSLLVVEHRPVLTGWLFQSHLPFQWTCFHCPQPFFLSQWNFILIKTDLEGEGWELHHPPFQFGDYAPVWVVSQVGPRLPGCSQSSLQGCNHQSHKPQPDPHLMAGQKGVQPPWGQTCCGLLCLGPSSFRRFRSMIVLPPSELKLWCLTKRVGLTENSYSHFSSISSTCLSAVIHW